MVRETKKPYFNKMSVEKYTKLSFMFIFMCLLVFLLVGCIKSTQKPVEDYATSGEATMTIIEHDFSGDYTSDSSNCTGNGPGGNEVETPGTFIENRLENIPYYFIAVHSEQDYGSEGEKKTEESFNYLAEMVPRADEYNIKLTLGFSKQWQEYITENPGRLAMLDEWSQSGHQIVYDDGFGLSSFTGSEDAGFKERPLESGPENGINEFILSGLVKGVERKWLTLYQVSNEECLSKAINTVEKIDSRVVYGVVFHSVKEQTPFFYAYLDYLYSLDPEGLNSKTLKSIIEKKLIQEKIIPQEVLDRQYQ